MTCTRAEVIPSTMSEVDLPRTESCQTRPGKSAVRYARLNYRRPSGGNVLVLGLNGSPNPGGASAQLLHAALAGARKEGAEVEQVLLFGLKVAPSDGCEKCVGECSIHDDNARLYALYPRMDALIV